MKRTLFLSVLLLALVFMSAQAAPTNAAPATPEPAASPSIDVDQLAARMPRNNDLYASLRDQSLMTYAKLHPAPSAYDAQAKTAIRLAVYLRVWGDFYGEGLWPIALDNAQQAISAGSTDPLLLVLQPIHTMEAVKSSDDNLAAKIDEKANTFAASEYPHAFKLWLFTLDARNLAGTKKNNLLKPPTAALLPKAVENAVNEFTQMVKAGVDNEFLAVAGEVLFHGLQADEDSIKQVGNQMDKLFLNENSNSALGYAMQGEYLITWAWNARGIGYANTVSSAQAGMFAEHLEKAGIILNSGYARHPEASMISREMLTVQLGQDNGRPEMETWFGRAIQANPNDFAAYMVKAYFLTPQWHGSDDDLWTYGVECSKSDNWTGKVPMVLVDLTVSYLWKKHPELFTDGTKWAIYHNTFQGFLGHFPNSVRYRSIYARWATEGGHFAEAEEQFKILGDNWDREVFPGGRYEEMRAKADAGAQTGAPAPK